VKFIPLLLLLASCGISQEYVKADRQTYDAVAPEFRAYVEADPKLDADKKAVRVHALETWDLRLKKAEK